MATGPITGSVKQQDALPTRKVIAGGVAGAVTAIAVYYLNNFVIVDVSKQITGDIGAAVTTVLSFVISYLVPPAASDQVKAE